MDTLSSEDLAYIKGYLSYKGVPPEEFQLGPSLRSISKTETTEELNYYKAYLGYRQEE